MLKKTRELFNSMCTRLAQGYSVASVAIAFAIEPTLAQALNDKIVEQSSFLKLINIVPVEEMEGEVIYGYAASPVSGRTNTAQNDKERNPKNLLGMEAYKYKLAQTNSDVAIRYNVIDAWAKFPDLAQRYARYVQERIANDRELIGWYGRMAAENTDMAANPMLQDVNKGWMQYMREYKPANILASGATPGKIRIGAGGDYTCLDVAVNDLVASIPPYLRKNLVALVGTDLITAEKSALYSAMGQTPTEKVWIQYALNTLGGLPWQTPSNFPPRGLVVTSLDNLSLYHQDKSWRRKLEDNAKKDQVEDYQSRNEGYVVECPEKFAALEHDNVQLPDGNGGWA
ncbi:phage major capsid protein, P2 family [Desulfovibrio cuneatus]|uniref:phage major capsid protein, P2 family n=1 Tax=Desulfovibrio cuneatus TaxID=159728 RepID=UPI000415E919|nr:phage major capsid protein, P2 family [Desulfovibrio cuneatus]